MSALTVTQLSAHIKGLLDQDALLRDVWVEGEASNCKEAVSGHWYFTLKDPGASLSCVMWKGQAALQSYLPEDGRAFQMHGVVSAYPAQGKYQLMVDQIEPLGQGDLHREFERIKAKLDAEGLFDPARKRRLPPYPRRIGLVTSPGAAALQDVLKVLGRRWPVAELFLAPTLVQGDAAPPQIVAALQAIGRAGVDVVLLIRGGGSLEDLWAFNDERVARAIVDCPVPVVSGVGHEIDFSIADFVADLRAPTPSAAAELATPDAWELRQRVDGLRALLDRQLGDRLSLAADGLDALRHRLDRCAPERGLAERRRGLAELGARLERAVQGDLRLRRSGAAGLAQRLASLSPQAVLTRGYAHVQRLRDGRTVGSTKDVGAAEGLTITVADGRIAAVTTGQARLFDEADHRPAAASSKHPQGTQRMSDIPADAPLDFEAAYATLEESVRRLESGTLNLDEAMTEYERGVALSSRCSQLLEAAEQRVSQIVVGGPQPIPGDPGSRTAPREGVRR